MRVTKAMLGKREITVTEHFPDNEEDMNKIRDIIAEFHLNNLRKYYNDRQLEVILPLRERYKELEKQNYEHEDFN